MFGCTFTFHSFQMPRKSSISNKHYFLIHLKTKEFSQGQKCGTQKFKHILPIIVLFRRFDPLNSQKTMVNIVIINQCW